MKTLREQVIEFHRRFSQPIAPEPRIIDHKRIRLRARLISEEFLEVMHSMFIGREMFLNVENHLREACDRLPVRVAMPLLADGLADLDYVIEGTRLEFGIDGGPIAEEVHRANMSKVGGGQRSDGKILKPDGFVPPDIESALRRQGWKP